MNLKNQDLATFPAPPSVIRTLIKGFNVVATHIYLILLPVILDLVLWLGPQLKIDAILEPFFAFVRESVQKPPADFLATLTEIQTNLNLFMVLRTYPVGVFSLFTNAVSNQTPWGVKTVINLVSGENALLLILAFNVLGILFGVFYFRAVAQTAVEVKNGSSLPRQILNVFLLNIAWSLVGIFVFVVASVMMFLLTFIGDPIRTVLGFVLTIPLAWVLMFAYYSFYPFFISSASLMDALRRGWRGL